MSEKANSPLIADLMLPELQRQLTEDPSLWPNVKGLFVITVTRKKTSEAVWYLLFQGNEVEPVITSDEANARKSVKGKVRTVKIQIEDHNLLNFITGGMSGVKAYMSGKIKVRGDLILAQRLEEVFEKAGGRDRALEFIKKNEKILVISGKSKL
ncbi:hypothetical protein J3Q64DRAFT_1733422 [Phycomyces blakesleeanus]|uniref:SCP2 domain-containing protein n=2 Tax=Phycomyces blakesleeanus TaxID=4837 RepID=A0A167L682_PHYB8|nr:hypothetical protein PHYBLDRAFT_182832 [Phycomyces blakesleeanus NRRL 1555(-)]OAD69688.1 hypothetical protein PHYBLDRAFT_182832 [Phycomyces blakesleeanus NRRL 1555(-)]|eukprot:XP_018287728.1 hypothetical protein PHYBLDRAFT_182832 [Phycomyces blakesleeanus NRRL 1555(-)]